MLHKIRTHSSHPACVNILCSGLLHNLVLSSPLLQTEWESVKGLSWEIEVKSKLIFTFYLSLDINTDLMGYSNSSHWTVTPSLIKVNKAQDYVIFLKNFCLFISLHTNAAPSLSPPLTESLSHRPVPLSLWGCYPFPVFPHSDASSLCRIMFILSHSGRTRQPSATYVPRA